MTRVRTRIWLPEEARDSATPGGWLDRARREGQPATSPVATNRAVRRRQQQARATRTRSN